jgi:hypothetical protein
MKLSLEGVEIPLECFSCGREIKPFTDEMCVIFFDKGTPNTRTTPGTPAEITLACWNCMEQGI